MKYKNFLGGDAGFGAQGASWPLAGSGHFRRLTRNGILRDTPNLMMMCLSSLPKSSTRSQQSLFPRWFCCWGLLVLTGVGSALGFAAGRARSFQEQQTPAKTEEKVPEGKSAEAPLADQDTTSSMQKELEKALQEFRVQAERVSSTATGPGNGNGSRPKTRDYRGNLYEYLRNDALDALPHQVRQANGTKSVLRRNQFGFNLTGPVRIPWLYNNRDNTFFSATYEGTREKIARPYLANIPTVQQRAGDFSDLVDNAGEPIAIYDPLTTRPNPDFNPAATGIHFEPSVLARRVSWKSNPTRTHGSGCPAYHWLLPESEHQCGTVSAQQFFRQRR